MTDKQMLPSDGPCAVTRMEPRLASQPCASDRETAVEPASVYSLLKELPNEASSEKRRELLRTVTDALSRKAHAPSDAEFAHLDSVLTEAAREYSLQVRTEFARLVAASITRFCQASEQFAMDEIEVAGPVLRHSLALSEETLLRVVAEKSQQHMLAVTQRSVVSEKVSHLIVERGDDKVVTSLLNNEHARIADTTYDIVARRAGSAPALQGPLIGRQGVPMDLLNGLYEKAEQELRREIMKKFESASPAELEKAFERSRARVTQAYRQVPQDLHQAKKKLASLKAAGSMQPPVLATLLREGQQSRTAFKLAFAHLTDVDYDVIDGALEAGDLDAIALLCRAARFDSGLFVTLAVGLDKSKLGLGNAEQFAKLYEGVSVESAQRAIRFWKMRAA
jgi:uncharacterized protein (DUF2336 family)